MNFSTKLLTLCSHTSDSSSQYAAQRILMIHFWSPLHADSQLISERCCCLKLCADILWNLQTVQPDYRLSHNSKSVCCSKSVRADIERNECDAASIKNSFQKFLIFRLTLLLLVTLDFNTGTLWYLTLNYLLSGVASLHTPKTLFFFNQFSYSWSFF